MAAELFVALIRNPLTLRPEPATREGVVIVGEPAELRLAFGGRLVAAGLASRYVDCGTRTMSVAAWLTP